MIRRPPRSTQGVSSAASDVYKRQTQSTWEPIQYDGYIRDNKHSLKTNVILLDRASARHFRKHCPGPVSYTHLRAHETSLHLVCRLLLEKKKNQLKYPAYIVYRINLSHQNI
eukprot:TRINITY_DN45247_c0_g1_i1.p2 TRINITY_DN45247_c0_g1~~TRINITY_DN45247_c0_g1_i1.p2  ORF type:complete len:112 (+),score=21.70 TRINITY_DN45247_c0_g1_i1:114-449(+)